MKKILSVLLTIVMLAAVIPQKAKVYAASDEEREAAQNLFQYLSPNDERTEPIYKAYKSGDYKTSLDLYRNYFIDKLRKTDVGQLGWHDSNIAGTYVGMADMLVGRMTAEQFAQKFDDRKHYDYLEWSGDPDEGKPVNWLGGIGGEQIAQSNGKGYEVNLGLLNKLAGAFWTNDYDTIYLKKYLQIVDDFCVNQKKVVDAYAEENGAPDEDVRFWRESGKYAQSYLWMFWREKNVLGCLAIFSKLLPTVEGFEKPEWSDVGKPVTTTLKPESYELMDSVKIAHIVYSLITDHMELSQNVLKDGFLIANQHADGVLTFAKMMDTFDEFTVCEQYEERVDHALNYLIEGIILPDGSLTERSFNYNTGTVDGYSELVNWLSYHGTALPSWSEAFGETVKNWDRLYAAYKTSNGHTPNIGNGGDTESAEPIWRDEAAYQKKKEEYQDKLDTNMDFNSVYFPYGGYGVMRSGWDIKTDMTLNFYNNGKKSGGHVANIVNAIWLTAYGRPLVASGACGWYGESFAPDSQKSVYEKMNAYFEESSTYKGSTVIVNGNDQAVGTESPSALLQSNWLNGTNFDYADGTFTGGYVANGKTEKDAEHERDFVYVKQAGLYIVEDTLKNTSGSANVYSQIWRMPCYNEDYENFTGFKENEVETDSNDNLLKTTDKTGPNIYISDFSSIDLEYKKYYGYQGDRFIGWSHGGTGGERVPAVDVHISWRDEKKGDETKVISVLDPVNGTETPYTEKKNLSDSEKDITGFSYTTDDGVKITYYSSAQPQELTYGDITVTACRLIVTEKDGEPINGIVCGDESGVNGYEFSMTENGMEKINTIAVPTYFKWVNAADGKYSPKYDSMDKESIESITASISNKTDNLRILKYSDSNYILKYDMRIAEEITDTLAAVPNMPDAKSTGKYVDSILKFIDKNKEIADYYGKADYSKKTAEIFGLISAKAEEYINNTQDSESIEIYKNIIAYITERGK